MLRRGLPQLNYLFFTLVFLLLGIGMATAQETPECEPGFRLFVHEFLVGDPVCIPEHPQRVAFLDAFHIPALLRAGVPLVTTTNHAFTISQFPEWQAAIEATSDVSSFPVNMEALLAADPDLIIGFDIVYEGNYDAFTAIAPIVRLNYPAGPGATYRFADLTDAIFEAAGAGDQHQALMDEYQARAAELGKLIPNADAIKVSLVLVLPNELRLYTDYSPGGVVLADVGFSRPDAQTLPADPYEIFSHPENYPEVAADTVQSPYLIRTSLETIDQADGDFIIVFGSFATSEDAQAALETLTSSPLWQSLPAVQAGNIHVTGINYAGNDIAGLHNILDDIARAFGVFDQLSPNPYKTVPEAEMTAEAAVEASS